MESDYVFDVNTLQVTCIK